MTANRKLNEVLIREDGFAKSEVTVSEGETVTFYANTKKKVDDFSFDKIGIVQVVQDDNSENYRPVVNGYHFESVDSKIIIKFKTVGEYLFKLKNHPAVTLPCKVKVVPEVPLNASLTDDGFYPKIIKIDEGTTIKWSWSKLSNPFSVFEAFLCDNHYEIQRKTKDLVIPSLSNEFTRKFDEPGVYYFQAESKSGKKSDLCVVEVQPSYREHTVEILDNKFSPARVTIDEGDVVWFYWNKSKCIKKHCVYQIYPPAPDHPTDRAYIAVKNGFKWSSPTRTGMVCHKFEKCGVYYYGDICGDECASYIGIVAVKPKNENKDLVYDENSKRFEQEIINASCGDMIWFRWDKKIPISIKLDESCLITDRSKKRPHIDSECKKYDSKFLKKSGIFSFKLNSVGCYYFNVENDTERFSVSIIASPVERDHKIIVTDQDAKPSILNIYPDDRVWFVWDDTKRPQNIRQVNHANRPIKDGFISGSLMESPGTFVEAFENLGIFYYTSDNYKGILGAIVVLPEPTIHVVKLNERGPNPDPIVINQNDIVVWKFDSEQTNNLFLIKNETDFYSYSKDSKDILPRRYLSYVFKESGVFHFVSPSFDITVRPEFVEQARGLDNTIISTVVVDKTEDYNTVIVDKNGFHPEIVNVEIGKSILFDWKETNESHNIIHVEMPENEFTFKPVTGPQAFNSGQVVLNNSFLHAFEEEGVFCVSSEGTSDNFCIIRVVDGAQKTQTPRLVNEEQFIMFKYHKVLLECETPNAEIYFTKDGSTPTKISEKYKKETGVIMNEEGIAIIRAIAFSDKNLTSDIFTSNRFYVVSEPEPQIDPYPNTKTVVESSNLNIEWWKLIPRVVINSIGVGSLEVLWDRVLENMIPYISHYQIFLNQVSYRKFIPADVNRVLVKGLTGDRNYDITVMIYPKDRSLLPQQSNIVKYNTPRVTNLGGPIISIKANRKPGQITVCWLSIDPKGDFIDSYELLINGEKRDQIKSSPGRHKITIDGCKPEIKYSIIVLAVPKDDSLPLISNELEIILPLDIDEITLPDQSKRTLEKDYYDEYIEITDLERTEHIKTDPVIINNEPIFAPYLSYDNYLVPNMDLGEPPVVSTPFTGVFIQQESEILNEEESFLIPHVESHEILDEEYKTNEETSITIDEESLPMPKVSVSNVSAGKILIEWFLLGVIPRQLELKHFVVAVSGTEFSSTIQSDASYECMIERDGQKIPSVQHCWIVKYKPDGENRIVINGILDHAVYQIIVNAVYKLIDSTDIREYVKSSKIIEYTPLGAPNPPKLRVNAVDVQSATLEWIPAAYQRPEYITGYRLIMNSEPSQTFDRETTQFQLTDMQPGRKYKVQIATLTNSIVPESAPSNAIILICPSRPIPPLISQLPSVRPNSAVVGWKPTEPRTNDPSDRIILYKVFVNKKYHGEIYSSNLASYSYMICELSEGKFYDVEVLAYCGTVLKHPIDDQLVSCMIASEPSNTLSVTPTAPPDAVALRLTSISTDGIEVSWSFPQQYGDATLSGFQLVRNGKCYGNIIPPDVSSTKLNDIELGETINLQMISLTNHPVGKYTPLQKAPGYSMDQPQRENLLNHVSTKFIHSDYPACKIGPVLTIKFSNIVKPVVKIWTEKVTGFSAIVAFQTSEVKTIKGKMNEHFVDPDYYLVSYWPGTNPIDKNIRTIKTEKDFVQLSNLKPTQLYTVQVESRKETKRLESEERTKSKQEYKFIIYSKSNLLQFQTAGPPDPPTNLTIISTTCHAIKVSWDPPVDHGSELIAIRIDCQSLDSKKNLHIFKELTPDKKSCILDNLTEKTRYKISVTVISEEYFINHKIKELKQLPKLILESMPWLPSASIESQTSGTDPATNLKCKPTHDSCIDISWRSAKVYGTNKLVNQIVCYQDITEEKLASQIPLPLHVKHFKLKNIKIGSKYKIWVEAVVMIKLNIESDSSIETGDNHYKELKDWRCTNVCSESIIYRVPAPCEPVIVNLTGYTNDSIEIYWAKPTLFSEHKDYDNSDSSYFLYRHLIGYRIEVNGIRQRSLAPDENFCVLTKCKPNTTYHIVVVALTCLIPSFEKANHISEDEIDIMDIDESFSEPLQVTTFSDNSETYLISLKGKFEKVMDTDDPSSIGRIRLDWEIPNISNIGQLNINWFSVEESLTRRKSFDPSIRHCFLPVTRPKCIYEVNLEVVSKESRTVFTTEKLFLEIPGAPDPPYIWLKEIKDNMVVVHWSEPRIYSNNLVDGYQLFLNDTKIGSRIDKQIQIASLPLKMNRSYKINIQALGSSDYPDSSLSNNLQVTTSASKFTRTETVSVVDKKVYTGSYHELELRKYYENENNMEFFEPKSCLPVKINRIGQDYVDLDWSGYVKENEGVNEYKIQWHCLHSNEFNDHRCGPNVTSYRIKRLASGVSYCIKVFAIKETNTVVKRSRNIIIQMNAAPDRPLIKLRACNFKYITIEWNRPMTYGELQIAAYKLYINGKVEAVLSGDQTSFTWSRGTPCEDYIFQVQALTSDESLASALSDPLRVTWPGIKVPMLRSFENENEVLRITWDEPTINGTAKVSYYRVIAENEHSGRVQIQGPFDESIRECEFRNLDVGRHKVHLEITAYGTVEPICSSPIYVDFGHRPEAPSLQIQVLGLAERRKLDKLACNLVNKRDTLLRSVTLKSDKTNLPKTIANLRQVDEALTDCIKLIANYTGFIVANLSWSCYQPNPIVRLLGFRIFVNGQQYGSDLNANARSIRIKLSLEKAIHSIYVTAFTDRTKMESQNSNVVEIISENFFPFSFFCLNNAHLRNKSWPEKGCCAYQDSLLIERDMIANSKEVVNLGKLKEKIETFKCEVIDLRTNKKINLETKSKSGKPTVILFWTKWCLSSIKALNFFIMVSRQMSSQIEFITCHCGNEENKDLYELIKKARYLDENVKFVNEIQYAGNTTSLEQFDLKGVPTLMFFNKNGFITWKGRYAAYNYKNFENFISHTFCSLNDLKCNNEACELCSRDTSIDLELIELRTEQKSLNQYLESYVKPTSDVWYGVETHKRSVPRLPRITTRQLISVPTYASMKDLRPKSERPIVSKKHLISAYSITSKSRANSSDGYCYRKSTKRILI